jgi:hypothetical protein
MNDNYNNQANQYVIRKQIMDLAESNVKLLNKNVNVVNKIIHKRFCLQC